MAAKDVETHVRYGAFLRAIPPVRRIGDYAHAAARILTAVFKRLLKMAPAWGPRAAANLHLGVHTASLFGGPNTFGCPSGKQSVWWIAYINAWVWGVFGGHNNNTSHDKYRSETMRHTT